MDEMKYVSGEFPEGVAYAFFYCKDDPESINELLPDMPANLKMPKKFGLEFRVGLDHEQIKKDTDEDPELKLVVKSMESQNMNYMLKATLPLTDKEVTNYLGVKAPTRNKITREYLVKIMNTLSWVLSDSSDSIENLDVSRVKDVKVFNKQENGRYFSRDLEVE